MPNPPSAPDAALLPLPPAVARRFPAYDPAALADPRYHALLVARLLEEGDADELRWLFTVVGRETVAAWLAAHGGAALSRRSRAFWSLVLGVAAPPPRPLARELWPLA